MALPERPPDDAEHSIETARDARLVERVRVGDAEAYGELVAAHMRRAFSIAYRLLGQREDAEDVVQDAFLRALERIGTLHRDRPFRPWFYRIVVNQALNFRRSRSVRATEPLPEQLQARTAAPDAAVEDAALRKRVHTALAALPERQRTVVQLAELEGMNSREIAAILEVSAGTVRWHLHEARRALRAALEPLEGEA